MHNHRIKVLDDDAQILCLVRWQRSLRLSARFYSLDQQQLPTAWLQEQNIQATRHSRADQVSMRNVAKHWEARAVRHVWAGDDVYSSALPREKRWPIIDSSGHKDLGEGESITLNPEWMVAFRSTTTWRESYGVSKDRGTWHVGLSSWLGISRDWLEVPRKDKQVSRCHWLSITFRYPSKA